MPFETFSEFGTPSGVNAVENEGLTIMNFYVPPSA